MIKTRFKQLNRWMLAAIVLSVAVLALVATLTTHTFRELRRLSEVEAIVAEVEVDVREMTAAARSAHQVLQLEFAAGTLLMLLLTLVIGGALRRLFTTRRLVEQGVARLVELIDKLARDEAVDAGMLPVTEDELQKIGTALLRMRKTLDATLLPRQQAANLLDRFGTLRLVLHADNAISHCSEGLCRLLSASDTSSAANILRRQVDFSRYLQLIRYGLVRDLDWQLEDAHGRWHRIRLSGTLLGEDALVLFGNPLADQGAADDEVPPFGCDGLILARSDGAIEAANLTAERLLGVPDATARGQTLACVCNRQRCSKVIARRDLAALASTRDTVELTLNPDGSEIEHHVQVRVYALGAEAGEDTTYALTLHDISWIRRSEARAQQLAFHDSLTGLPNRTLFIEQLGRAINAARRHSGQFAVLFLDLDGFKDINDSLGHHAGDRLLQEVCKRMRSQLRDTEFAARFGGDEFCVLTDELDQAEDAGRLAARVIEALKRPYRLGNQTLTPRASIGIGVYPDNGATPQALLQAADTAMYEAKRKCNQRFVFHSDEMTERARQRMTLDAELHSAVESWQFVLFYQPQIDLRTGRMVAVEALIRWQHPKRGLLPPDEFIPAAERLGLVGVIGHWVMVSACRQLAAWRSAGVDTLRMAVNIAPTHFQQPGFAQEVAAILQEAGLEPRSLEVEITERMARDPEAHVATCEALRRLGVRIAIDDFGVGYSSLSVLRRLQVHTLKIDQLFLRDVLDDPKTTLMLGGIVAMAKGLALEAVVEGVETLQQLELVYGLGCTLAQGYYFGKPLLAREIPALTRVDLTARSRPRPHSARVRR
ncbi:MAG: EAL domain-containing protein [Nitrococcus sp.]|nr:EAL domain-containing protein [Nitrococcus sp.]